MALEVGVERLEHHALAGGDGPQGGEFGRVEPTAVLDTLGVDPDYRNQGVGRALLSQLFMNLTTLRVEGVRTEISWADQNLVPFLERCGFRPSQRLCLELATK